MKRRNFLAAAVLAVSAHFIRLPKVVDPFLRDRSYFVLPGEGIGDFAYNLAAAAQHVKNDIERMCLDRMADAR